LLNAGDERHKVSNDKVERRGAALPLNEATLSQSSTPPWLTEDATPQSLQPMVRHQPQFVRPCALTPCPCACQA
jgi:hypothetical protein